MTPWWWRCFGSVLLLALLRWDPAAMAAWPPSVSLEEVRRVIDAAPREHPRLFVTRAELAALRSPPPAGSLRQVILNEVLREARSTLKKPTVVRELKGRRLLTQSRRCLERVLALAVAYHATGRREFLERAELEMVTAAGFSDWNPSHFLDVAEMSFALAVGYDWLQADLTPSARETIRSALVSKALRLPLEEGFTHWVDARHNWGQVCHGGLSVAALALLETDPDLAARTVHNAVNHLHFSMDAYAPRGSYPEGPAYWSFGTTYNVLLIAALESALGTDFTLSTAPGFAETGQYLPLVTGPSGATFNYSDGAATRNPEPALFWFAQRYQRGEWLAREPELLRARPGDAGRFLPLTLFWAADPPPSAGPGLPLHWSGEGSVPITLHRTSWDARAVFVGFKGGSPSANHGHMDGGSFVLDAEGVRWAVDLGAEEYHGVEARGMNLWDKKQDSDRWTIFRQMNLAHSTLVIDQQPQKVAGAGKLVRFSDAPGLPHSVLDLSTLYAGQVTSARRGIALLSSGEVVVQDELAGLRPGAVVRWAMVTPAEPEAAGSASLTLRRDGRQLSLRVEAPAEATWSMVDAARPRNPWDSPNPGIRLATFETAAPADGQLRLRVRLVPGSAAGAPSAAVPAQLDDWR